MGKSKKGKEKTSDSEIRNDDNADPSSIPAPAAKSITRQLKEKNLDKTFEGFLECCLRIGSGGCSCGKWVLSGCWGFLKLVGAFVVALLILWVMSMFAPQQVLSNFSSYIGDVFSRKLQQRAA